MEPSEALKNANNTLLSWCKLCSHCLGQAYDICAPYIANESQFLDPLVRFVIAQLLISCQLTSESTFLLITNQKMWDAEILIRSVLEGTFKFAYILEGTSIESVEKTKEYWEILPGMARLTRHQRAADLLDVFDGRDSTVQRPIVDLLLTAEEEKELRGSYSRKKRRTLLQKWSFMEIARYFATHPDESYHCMGTLGYSYGIQSHLVHQDGDGVGMIWERCVRDAKRRTSVELAHAGRLISDACHFAFFRTCQLLRAAKQPLEPLDELTVKFSPLFKEIKCIGEVWHKIEYGPANTPGGD